MRSLQSILVATDFRPASLDVENAVARLAKATGGRVTLLHVLNPLQFWPAQMPDLRDEADDLLKIVADRLGNAGVEIDDVLLEQGQQSDTIIRKATALDADVVVIGAGEQKDNGRFYTGPMAETIIQYSDRPVLAVRPGDPPLTFKNILCPVDHSAPAKRGLQNAVALSRICDAKLTVLTVIPDVSWLASAIETGKLAGATAEHDQKWRDEFDQFLGGVDFAGVSHREEVRKGIPDKEIMMAVLEREADLIVMGCTGRSGVARMLLGSNTRRLLRRLPCSLLTLKEEGVMEDMFDEDIRTINLLFSEGQELLKAEAYHSAQRKFHQLLQRNPYHIRALESYAEACAKLGHEKEAQLHRRRAAALRETDWS